MSKYKIIIHKECRKLKLYLDNEIIATYQIGLGTSPKAKKPLTVIAKLLKANTIFVLKIQKANIIFH